MAKKEEEGASKRAHKASYSRDKKKGGWLVTVEGPNAAKFAGRSVPVTTLDGSEHEEKLTTLIWSGVDDKTGKPRALYNFEPKPKADKAEDVVF